MSVRPQYRSRQFPEPAVLEWHQLARLGSPSGDVLAAFEIIPAVDVDLFPVSPKSAGSGSARRDRLNGSLKKKNAGVVCPHAELIEMELGPKRHMMHAIPDDIRPVMQDTRIRVWLHAVWPRSCMVLTLGPRLY